MSLIAEGESAAAIGVGSFGAGGGGGAAFAFSDMLGDRLLTTAAQVGTHLSDTTNVNDVAFQTAYVRQDRRWTWGLLGGQIPYLISAFASEPGPGEIERQTAVRETQRRASAILMYPFDRARRVEFTGGLAQVVRDEIVTSVVYSESTGSFEANAVTRPIGDRLQLATSAAALVSDTTTFGPLGPVQGQRYRFEVAPTFGSIDFAGVLVDYRKYAMPVAFYTVAARVIHYGRYGADADDDRLHPIYLNDPSFVRGYGVGEPSSSFVESRVLVGNVELRFPALRPFGVSPRMYGPIPIEIAIFGDSGVGLGRRVKRSATGDARLGIRSAGVAVRVALGFAAAEFDVVRPFQRLDDQWRFGFNLLPAW
jgi:hypothetical protein